MAAAKVIAVIVAVVVLGRYVIDGILRLVALTRVKEAMTAAALLTVIGVALLMQLAGLSASLGAFLAGALLADSSYRHELEADIQPFQGLLLGLFFTAIGMSLNVQLLFEKPMLVFLLVALLVVVKSVVLFIVGRWWGLPAGGSRRLALALSQGGEFAFVLLTTGVVAGVVQTGPAELFALIVTLSMIATPLLLLADRLLFPPKRDPLPAFDPMPAKDGHVIIAGFGRFGQIIARVLRAKQIPFTALDVSPEQIAFVRKFGSQAFFGDASRPDILAAAQANKARAFVLAIDDVEASLRTAEIVRKTYPTLPVYARARNRNHVHKLTDLGVEIIRRETFLSALDLTREVLKGLGLGEHEASRAVETFKAHDERRLRDDYKHYSDIEKLQETARSDAANLEKLFREDAEETVKADSAAPGPKRTKDRADEAKKRRQKERADADRR
jgi:glutathione-regulated potassium-efflux system protein KefB